MSNETTERTAERHELEAKALFDRWKVRKPGIVNDHPWHRQQERLRDDFRGLARDAAKARAEVSVLLINIDEIVDNVGAATGCVDVAWLRQKLIRLARGF